VIVLIGTVPYETGLYTGTPELSGGHLTVGGARLPVGRGTAAMAAACTQVCSFYGLPAPLCILGGDVADGRGTAIMFAEVESGLQGYDASVIVLHYLFPKLAYAAPFMDKLSSLPLKPQLIADAGGMYLMKAAKKSRLVDVFTPDLAELAFLADEFAPHPLYVRDISPAATRIESMVVEAYRHNNAAQTLVIKGPADYVYRGTTRVGTCERPNIPAMEAIGGTGDTITGMIAALRFRREDSPELKALRLNRLAGELASCNPATQINEFINAIPDAIDRYEKRTS
jgi:ADP-dependent NAD(P)H-hydrate dehydratase / NAD(P)H-hydrate epimerase